MSLQLEKHQFDKHVEKRVHALLEQQGNAVPWFTLLGPASVIPSCPYFLYFLPFTTCCCISVFASL